MQVVHNILNGDRDLIGSKTSVKSNDIIWRNKTSVKSDVIYGELELAA